MEDEQATINAAHARSVVIAFKKSVSTKYRKC
jgi:hypothetical protein